MKILIIVFGLLYTVNCKPADSDYLDDTQNTNYPDYADQEEVPEEAIAPKPLEDDKSVVITTKEQEFVRNISETIVLPCEMSNEDYVRMWQKNGVLLFQATVQLSGGQNLKLVNGNLEISDLHEDDSGHYECIVLVNDKYRPKITHNLLIRTPPRIEYLTVKDNIKILKSGDTLELTCKAKGYPKPVVSWHREHESLYVQGETLRIDDVKHRDAGEYKCLADNKIGNPDFKFIDIKVEFKPEVTIERISVSSENNLDTELKCIVHAEPKASVNWKKDGINVVNSQHMILNSSRNDHVLIIKGLQESDFGVYTCSASNYKGQTDKNITLVKTPAILKFIKPRTDTRDVVLTWEVQSKTPISGHELQYRKKGESTWTLVTPEVDNVEKDIYTVKYELNGLAPGVYETRIRSQNSNGWSEYSEIMPFEGVYVKHGHHKSHKKGHRDGKAKQIPPTQEIPRTTQTNKPLDSGEPAEHQENVTIRDASVVAENTSGSSSLTPTMVFINLALIVLLQINPPTMRI